MNGPTISPEVRDFIAAFITSVVELEAVLLLHAEAGQGREARELADKLKVDPLWLNAQLRELCARGVLQCSDAPQPRYSYRPHSVELDRAVQQLASIYADLRVQIISLIYSKPIDKIQVFADAFRIRKDKTDG